MTLNSIMVNEKQNTKSFIAVGFHLYNILGKAKLQEQWFSEIWDREVIDYKESGENLLGVMEIGAVII